MRVRLNRPESAQECHLRGAGCLPRKALPWSPLRYSNGACGPTTPPWRDKTCTFLVQGPDLALSQASPFGGGRGQPHPPERTPPGRPFRGAGAPPIRPGRSLQFRFVSLGIRNVKSRPSISYQMIVYSPKGLKTAHGQKNGTRSLQTADAPQKVFLTAVKRSVGRSGGSSSGGFGGAGPREGVRGSCEPCPRRSPPPS